ncbi:MAG: decaprenyl-phosphate phosphoribosyltransferase [Gemmataceae bacterium]
MELTRSPIQTTSLRDIVSICRPRQWTKNVFVLAPVLFSESIGNPANLLSAGIAFVCFCFWSSSVYCLNDVIDAKADRQHPRKRFRPIPSGRVSSVTATMLGIGLAAFAGVIAYQALPLPFLLFGSTYLANSVVYCLLLKHRVIVDVLSIAIGFVLRLLAGCAAINVDPTSWILVCGFSLAMLLGFGKRRLEVDVVGDSYEFRPALQSYSVDKLNLVLGVTSSICLLSYMLYTVSPETVKLHHTDKLVYTVPFVAYGIFRYIFKVQEGQHDGPVEVLLKDPIFALNGLLWLLTTIAVLYLNRALGATAP